MSASTSYQEQWSRPTLLHLIELYRQHSCLWNVKLDTYKDRNKRAAALQIISEEIKKIGVSVTANETKKKIDILRGQQRREMRKKRKSQKSGASTDDIYTPTLWCFDLLSFLNDGDDIRESATNLENTPEVNTPSDHEVCTHLFRYRYCHDLCLDNI